MPPATERHAGRHLRLLPPPPPDAVAPAPHSRGALLLRIAFAIACVLVVAAICRAVALETTDSVAPQRTVTLPH
jgi:hypothetical protein